MSTTPFPAGTFTPRPGPGAPARMLAAQAGTAERPPARSQWRAREGHGGSWHLRFGRSVVGAYPGGAFGQPRRTARTVVRRSFDAGDARVEVIGTRFSVENATGRVTVAVAHGRVEVRGARVPHGFVALEDWINDGVPLAHNVAVECLQSWYGDNAPARGSWEVAGQPIRAEDLAAPTLVVLPRRDRIVPPRSAAPLATAIPQAEVLRPAFGHIGMMASAEASATLWRPITDWLEARLA